MWMMRPATAGKTGCELLGMIRSNPTVEEYESAAFGANESP